MKNSVILFLVKITIYCHCESKNPNFLLHLFFVALLGFASIDECPFKLLSRYHLKQKIQKTFSEHQSSLVHLFETVDHVCLTSDIWGNKHRSFFGVTAHFLSPEDFSRKSAALACPRFPYPHTHERIAEQIQYCLATYGLSANKVIGVITDNAKNFEKAFREFGLASSEFDFFEDQMRSTRVMYDSEEIIFTDAFDSMVLPNRFRCNAHTINLIGTNNIITAKQDTNYSRLYVQCFSKLNRIWNKTQYPKSSETIKNILSSSLGRPVPSRWNSIPDSVGEILSKEPHKLDHLMTVFEIPIFSSVERLFLKEYLNVMTIITSALDNLQKTECYYAILLPTLLGMKRQLKNMSMDANIKYCKPLAKAAFDGLMERFTSVLNFKTKDAIPAVIASVCHPFFKLRWLREEKTEETTELIRTILVKAMGDINVNEGATQIQQTREESMRIITSNN